MKCPYRKHIVTEKSYQDDNPTEKEEIIEEFAECVADECPFYKHLYQPRCKKVDAEVGKE